MKRAIVVLAVLIGIGVLVYERHERRQDREQCGELVSDLAKLYPDVSYDKLPLLRQVELRDLCGIDVR